MFTLYNQPGVEEPRQVSLGRFGRILTAHQENLSRVVHHYRRAHHSVRSNHLLVRILQTLPSGEGLDLNQYRNLVEDYTDELTRALDLSSPINVGSAQSPGPFFGEGVEEIIVVHSNPFSLGEFKAQWRERSPVTFLRHPKGDLCLNLPDGVNKDGQGGLAVALVDVPLLACQYRLWRARERRVNKEYQRTPMQFIHSVVLANSLRSLADIGYFNMFRRVFSGEPLKEVAHSHPFFLNTYHEDTWDGLAELQYKLSRNKMSFGSVLESVETPTGGTLRESVAIPSMPFTRQVRWALTAARIPLISLLLLWDERTGGSFNRAEKNRVNRSLRQLRSDRALGALNTNHLKVQVEAEIEFDIRPFL